MSEETIPSLFLTKKKMLLLNYNLSRCVITIVAERGTFKMKSFLILNMI